MNNGKVKHEKLKQKKTKKRQKQIIKLVTKWNKQKREKEAN